MKPQSATEIHSASRVRIVVGASLAVGTAGLVTVIALAVLFHHNIAHFAQQKALPFFTHSVPQWLQNHKSLLISFGIGFGIATGTGLSWLVGKRVYYYKTTKTLDEIQDG